MRKSLPPSLVRILHYEYWPFYVFFLPLVPYYLYLALKHRSFTFFTLANPCIPHGGVFGESKVDILNKFDAKYHPKHIFCERGVTLQEIQVGMASKGINYPIIAKPNVGERGERVEKIHEITTLQQYLVNYDNEFIIQEFIDYPIELGVLYFRTPLSGNSGITSIVQKEFLTVIGDGRSSLLQLISRHDRARVHLKTLAEKWSEKYELVPALGEKIELQPIGNHCLGTKFLDATSLISPALVKVFDKIAEGIEGFDYGRFDIRVKDLASLKAGEHISVLELNGVTSEPGHIYDPKFNLFQAYRSTIVSLKRLSEVCKENKLAGHRETPLLILIKLIMCHFNLKQTEDKKEIIYS